MTEKIALQVFFGIVFLSGSIVDATIEQSIIPLMESFESVDNLNSNKYSKNQFAQISQALAQKNEKIRVVSFNILFNINDSKLNEVNRWPQRLPRIVELWDEMQADIIGVQEMYPDMLKNIMPFLENEYAFYSQPCADGELNGIFYRKDRFSVVESHVWYISKTPEKPSSETLTMLQLKDNSTDKILAVFNTHLAFSNVNKREYQARFIAKYIAPIAKEMPVVLTGDFNTFSNRPELNKLPFFDGDYIHRILTKKSLKDAREQSLIGHVGPISTFTNVDNDPTPFLGTGTPGIMLDHIYISSDVTVLMHAVQTAKVNGHFPSDHLPVIIDLILKKEADKETLPASQKG